MGLRNNPLDCPKNFRDYAIEFLIVLANELFPKALQSLERWVLVNNDLCGKVLSSLESLTTFDESFKVTAVTIFYS